MKRFKEKELELFEDFIAIDRTITDCRQAIMDGKPFEGMDGLEDKLGLLIGI